MPGRLVRRLHISFQTVRENLAERIVEGTRLLRLNWGRGARKIGSIAAPLAVPGSVCGVRDIQVVVQDEKLLSGIVHYFLAEMGYQKGDGGRLSIFVVSWQS